MKSNRIECATKPQSCPECGKAPLATILYGMPAFDQELEQEMKKGRVTLGGCCISYDDPVWECTGCGLQIFQSGPEKPLK